VTINRPASLTLLALAALVIAFLATWLTIPAGRYESKNLTTGRWETSQVAYPAKLLRSGLRSRETSCASSTPTNPCAGAQTVRLRTDLHALRSRVVVVFGGVAAAVVLVGVALGALRGY
jgi:uncharacterized ion transporter superfamily protein YfcC